MRKSDKQTHILLTLPKRRPRPQSIHLQKMPKTKTGGRRMIAESSLEIGGNKQNVPRTESTLTFSVGSPRKPQTKNNRSSGEVSPRQQPLSCLHKSEGKYDSKISGSQHEIQTEDEQTTRTNNRKNCRAQRPIRNHKPMARKNSNRKKENNNRNRTNGGEQRWVNQW